MQIDALQNTNCRGGDFCVFLYKNCRLELFGGCQFTFWRAPIYILEAEIVLGVLYRKGVIPKKGGTLDFPRIFSNEIVQNSVAISVVFLGGLEEGKWWLMIFVVRPERQKT